MSIVIDRKLHRAFKAAASAQGKSMSKLLIEFIEQYVKEHPAAGPAKKGGR